MRNAVLNQLFIVRSIGTLTRIVRVAPSSTVTGDSILRERK